MNQYEIVYEFNVHNEFKMLTRTGYATQYLYSQHSGRVMEQSLSSKTAWTI